MQKRIFFFGGGGTLNRKSMSGAPSKEELSRTVCMQIFLAATKRRSTPIVCEYTLLNSFYARFDHLNKDSISNHSRCEKNSKCI